MTQQEFNTVEYGKDYELTMVNGNVLTGYKLRGRPAFCNSTGCKEIYPIGDVVRAVKKEA